MATPRRRVPTWLVLGGGLASVALMLFAMDVWSRHRARGDAGPPPLDAPLRLADVGAHEALLVELGPGGEDADGLPQVVVRFRECTWLLAHPVPRSAIVEVTEVWNRLAPTYESVCTSFADAVRKVREREPERTIGVIRTRGSEEEVPDTVVGFVSEAFADAGVTQVVVDAGPGS